MATRQLITCDRCGDEIHGEPMHTIPASHFDLCGVCNEMLVRMMEAFRTGAAYQLKRIYRRTEEWAAER